MVAHGAGWAPAWSAQALDLAKELLAQNAAQLMHQARALLLTPPAALLQVCYMSLDTVNHSNDAITSGSHDLDDRETPSKPAITASLRASGSSMAPNQGSEPPTPCRSPLCTTGERQTPPRGSRQTLASVICVARSAAAYPVLRRVLMAPPRSDRPAERRNPAPSWRFATARGDPSSLRS